VTNTSHSFVIFELPADEQDGEDQHAIVTVETIHAYLTVNDPESIALYRERWSLLEQMAIFGDEARAFLGEVSADLRTAQE
jgi:hypothetical protein